MNAAAGSKDERRPIISLQIMRGIAAVSVVAFHTSLIMAKPQYGSMHAFESATSRGWIGVNFFFVLSGFIILYAHAKDIGRPQQLGSYLWRRFSRLYPAYWVFLTLYVAAALLGFGPMNFRLSWVDMLTAYTLFRWVYDPNIPLKVAWTLIFEVSFYLVFAIAIMNRRAGIAVSCVWLVGIVIASVLGSLDAGRFSMWNINFFFGGAAWLLFRRTDRAWGLPMLVAGLTSLTALIAFNDTYDSIDTQQATPISLMLLGLSLCLIVSGGALVEERYGALTNRALLMLGEASYAIYLVHSAVISALCQIAYRFAVSRVPSELIFVAIFIFAVLAGIVAHFVVERPLLLAIRRLGALHNVIVRSGWRRTEKVAERTRL